MKKVLIWDLNYALKNSGGPAGYLYNIREYLNSNPAEEIEIFFLKDILGIPNKDTSINTNYKGLMKVIHKIDFLSIIGYYRSVRCLKRWNRFTEAGILHGINLNEFDAIHFHHSGDLYRASKVIEAYNGTIILTSHSPQPQSFEDVENITYKKSIMKSIIRNKIAQKELKAWDMADYLMFPVEDALEPYYVDDRLKNYKESHSDKFVYCESSILDKPISEPVTKKELGIDDSKILISYVGRHNEIKGYDQLKLFAQKVLSKDDRFVFVIAGNEEPITRLNHPNWIELGWINYGNRVVSGSDLFILPNKDTYFDLVTLEVMREGTPILMSNTGGNKYFQKYGNEYGIYSYKYGDIDDQMQQFEYLLSDLRSGQIRNKSHKIRKLFEDKFTIKSYIVRYSSLVNSIC